ncbi:MULTISPECIES: type II toxin-antitoxin system PemK/MazF family toxin [unclassified Sphingomonas]|uniref:type II toxin-antitoxin system PemK/MazF family toxin n=1 Tax=unclassified Sphingomonas TaxID=196159 RepID=UPI00161AA191|nr:MULTISPECIES: type II toxin-antitoxin system PemK/MazF family toxin [unclassified Sphingomonas]MBB3345682.1 mRNA interferase MazF [Sphingomonas sp. BK069]MBB3474693.1 mRNA interferase MazF [Sphingomonas sp. BK345]
MAVTPAEQATGAADTVPAITHGAIVELAAPEAATGGPRVCVVVQADLFNETHATVTLCPLTAVVGGESLFRVAISPQEHTGLTVECEVQVDRITSVRRHRIVKVIGHASATRMEQVDQALRRWLAL